MAFFDSPKNRALWERKLSVLREEKARRKTNGYSPVDREGKAGSRQDNPYRKRITIKELEARVEGEQTRRRERPERQARQAQGAMERGGKPGQEFRETGGQPGAEYRETERGQAGEFLTERNQPGRELRETGMAQDQAVKETKGRQL